MGGFTQLEVRQRTHELVLEIYKVTERFPSAERLRLTDQQFRFQLTSLKGRGRNTLKEYFQFLYNTHGSLEETKYHLLLVKDLHYVNGTEYKDLKERCDQIRKMVNGLINSLRATRGQRNE